MSFHRVCCCDDAGKDPKKLGACCLPDGTCIDGVTVQFCAAQQGAWQGIGSTCDPNPCPVGLCDLVGPFNNPNPGAEFFTVNYLHHGINAVLFHDPVGPDPAYSCSWPSQAGGSFQIQYTGGLGYSIVNPQPGAITNQGGTCFFTNTGGTCTFGSGSYCLTGPPHISRAGPAGGDKAWRLTAVQSVRHDNTGNEGGFQDILGQITYHFRKLATASGQPSTMTGNWTLCSTSVSWGTSPIDLGCGAGQCGLDVSSFGVLQMFVS